MRIAIAVLLATTALGDTPVAPRVYGPSPEPVFNANVASDGLGFVVAESVPRGVRLQSVTVAGVVENRDAILTGDASVQDFCASGDGYLLAYGVLRGIRVARVDTDGFIRDTRFVADSLNASIAAYAGRALLATERGTSVLLDGEGNVLREETPFELPGETYSMSVGAGENGFAIVWMGLDENLHAAFLSRSGEVTMHPVTLGPSNPVGFSGERPAIASDGSSFFVAWPVDRELRGITLGSDGHPRGEVATIATSAERITGPSMVWDGARFLVVYESGGDLHSVTPGRPAERLVARDRLQGGADVAASAAGILYTWSDLSDCFEGWQLMASFDPRYGTHTLLTKDLSKQSQASIATHEGRLAAAWLERSDRLSVRVRVGDAVLTLDDQALAIPPAVAAGRETTAVAWLSRGESCDTGVMRVAVIDAAGHPIRNEILTRQIAAGATPFLLWSGSEFIAVWERANAELLGVPLSPTGEPDGPPRVLTPAYPPPDGYTSIRAVSPSLVATGDGYKLVWMHLRHSYIPLYPTPPPPVLEVRTEPLSLDLLPGCCTEVLGSNASAPASAHGPAGTLVAWRENSGETGRLRARLIAPSGLVVVDAVTGFTASTEPHVAATRGVFVIAFGTHVVAIAPNGRVYEYATLPDGAIATGIAESGEGVVVAWDLDEASLLRSISLQRRRAAR